MERHEPHAPRTTGPQAGPEPDPPPPPPCLNLELLVHGVGGTTPAEMLGDPQVQRITGDDTAAVYRRTDDVDAECRPEQYADRPIPEAYSWAGLTSGNGSRALWLVLLPFMVANLVHWMRPFSGGSRDTAVRLHGLLARLVALSLTVLLAAAACEVALDLVAWQCAGSAGCVRDHSWLGFMAQSADGSGGWWSQPGRRLALAAAVPAALTAVLWWLSHRTWSAYESQPPLRRDVTDYDAAAADRPALCLPGFWFGRRIVARLRAAHTAAGLLTVAAALLTPALRHDLRSGADGPPPALGWALAALVAACAVWTVYVVCRRGPGAGPADEAPDTVVRRALPAAALALLLLAALHAGWSRPGWDEAGRLPGDETFAGITVAQCLLVGVLAVLGAVRFRARPVARTALHGLAPAAVAELACALGGLMTGGVAQRVGDWLDGDGDGASGAGGAALPGPPVVLTWHASTIPVLLLLLLLLLGFRALRMLRQGEDLCDDVLRGYPGARPEPSRSRQIGAAVARACVTDSAPWLVGATALMMLVLGAGAVLGTVLTHEAPGPAADGLPALLDGCADVVQALGSWLMGAAFLLLVTWGVRAYRDPAARRTVGILWDVGTFWPRAAHPFAPPCYAERAVPDLAWRMATWTASTGGRLVISGHSQGSVLAASAVWHLDPVTRGRVALLTYGSPLERLYGRWFPAYFGPRQLADLHREVDCWCNLWRLTDPIGGPVRIPAGDGPAVDRGPLLDPLEYGRTLLHPLPEPVLAHSHYQADPAFDEERDRLLVRLRERGPLPALPADTPVEAVRRSGAPVPPQAAPPEGYRSEPGRSSA